MLAIGIDVVVSLLLFNRIYPVSSLLVGGFLVGLPYSLMRGLTNRLTHTRVRALPGTPNNPTSV